MKVLIPIAICSWHSWSHDLIIWKKFGPIAWVHFKWTRFWCSENTYSKVGVFLKQTHFQHMSHFLPFIQTKTCFLLVNVVVSQHLPGAFDWWWCGQLYRCCQHLQRNCHWCNRWEFLGKSWCQTWIIKVWTWYRSGFGDWCRISFIKCMVIVLLMFGVWRFVSKISLFSNSCLFLSGWMVGYIGSVISIKSEGIEVEIASFSVFFLEFVAAPTK